LATSFQSAIILAFHSNGTGSRYIVIPRSRVCLLLAPFSVFARTGSLGRQRRPPLVLQVKSQVVVVFLSTPSRSQLPFALQLPTSLSDLIRRFDSIFKRYRPIPPRLSRRTRNWPPLLSSLFSFFISSPAKYGPSLLLQVLLWSSSFVRPSHTHLLALYFCLFLPMPFFTAAACLGGPVLSLISMFAHRLTRSHSLSVHYFCSPFISRGCPVLRRADRTGISSMFLSLLVTRLSHLASESKTVVLEKIISYIM